MYFLKSNNNCVHILSPLILAVVSNNNIIIIIINIYIAQFLYRYSVALYNELKLRIKIKLNSRKLLHYLKTD